MVSDFGDARGIIHIDKNQKESRSNRKYNINLLDRFKKIGKKKHQIRQATKR